MLKLSEYLGTYINKEGETIYYYRPSITSCSDSSLWIDIEPQKEEIAKIETIDIPYSMNLMMGGMAAGFPNLKKLIIREHCPVYSRTLAFDHGAFNRCPNLREVHVYRNICFSNRHGKLDWKRPFQDSKDVIFYYHTDVCDSIGSDHEPCCAEFERWNMRYEIVQNGSYEETNPAPYLWDLDYE